MFANLLKIVDYLSREGKSRKMFPKVSKAEDSSASDCDSNYSDSSFDHDSRDGYYAIKSILVDQIYVEFFYPDRYDHQLRNEVLPHVLDQMVLVCETLDSKDKKQKIIPIILDCISDREDDDRRLIGVRLLDGVSEALGMEICRDHLLYELVSLQDDPVYEIRKEVVGKLVKISMLLGEQILNGVIIPVFKKLSSD